MCTIVVELVEFDYDETCYEEIEAKVDEKEVGSCALAFLGVGVCWLQNQDGLRKDEDAARVKERVGREEDQIREEDAGPDGGYKQDEADLGNNCGACRRVSRRPLMALRARLTNQDIIVDSFAFWLRCVASVSKKGLFFSNSRFARICSNIWYPCI
jgi:hypothetical protein